MTERKSQPRQRPPERHFLHHPQHSLGKMRTSPCQRHLQLQTDTFEYEAKEHRRMSMNARSVRDSMFENQQQ